MTSLFLTPLLHAHGGDPRHRVPLSWERPEISRAIGLDRSLGLRGRGVASVREVDGRSCLEGSLIGFDVDDAFGFDLDETVTITLVVDTSATPDQIAVGYDASASAGKIVPVEVPATGESRFVEVTAALERARFAGRGSFGTDLAVAAQRGRTLRLCDLRLSRSAGAEPATRETGTLALRFLDGEAATTARVGLYDGTGRMPLPATDAVALRHFGEVVRQVAVRAGSPWPHDNRSVFYVDGEYSARLPAGEYQIVASKGLEYRITRKAVRVPAGGAARVDVRLRRWTNQRGRGWYSGDTHVHVTRRPEDEGEILAQASAEDLQVSNLLQIGNIQSTYFEQSSWGKAGQGGGGRHILVSGQEDPTTGHRGHVLALDLEAPIRHPDRYFLYHRVFDDAHLQGGLVGYAHLPAGWFHVERGLALDVPFGDVDFVEVLQIGLLDVELWYPFLNLGYRMVPVAGSDYPYIDLPGTVRSYVKVDGPFSTDRWFDGLRAGNTFVTNGPLLELDVNGRGMGATLIAERGSEVRVRAEASIHPDWDRLARLELVAHGEVIASRTSEEGAEKLVLEHSFPADESLWLAVRVRGTFEQDWNSVAAHSAPVYVGVDGEPTWKKDAVAAIVERQLEYLDALGSEAIDPSEDLMYWRTEATTRERWLAERHYLTGRIEEARRIYEGLLELIDERPHPQPATSPTPR